MSHGKIFGPPPKPKVPVPAAKAEPSPEIVTETTFGPEPVVEPGTLPVRESDLAPEPAPVQAPDPERVMDTAPLPALEEYMESAPVVAQEAAPSVVEIPAPIPAPPPIPDVKMAPAPAPSPAAEVAPARVEQSPTRLNAVIQQFRMEFGADLISTEVVGMDGISIAGGSDDPAYDSTEAAARFSTVMKLAAKASSRVGMGRVEDNLTTTDKTYIIARFIGDGSYYWGVTVTRFATLGSVRMVMNEYAARVWEAIPR
jgi:predicted regulator of Ras-like GTPase activity (Roadblock/LC7/MglB family)